MEIGTKYKFSNNKIGILIQKNNNFGLFKFENGSKYVFNLKIMNEAEFKKKMQHFLKINNDLYKENQVLKKALEINNNKINDLNHYIKTMENAIKNIKMQ
jgi:hypothetical protein